MPELSTERQFLAAMRDWLVTLPHDLKILFEAATDEDLDRSARELAIGAIIYTVSATHLPGVPREDFTNYCDRAILVHVALQRIVDGGGEHVDDFKSRFPDFFESLDRRVTLCNEALGESHAWIHTLCDRLTKVAEYRGKKAPQFLDDEEASGYLYEEGLEFQTEYDVDEEVLADRLKKARTIFDALKKRKKLANPRTS